MYEQSSVCLVSLLTRKPNSRAPLRNNGRGLAENRLLSSPLAPQLFRVMVVRSFYVSRFTVNKT